MGLIVVDYSQPGHEPIVMIRGARGFTITEILIASALVIVVLVSVSFLVTSSKKTAALVTGSAECQSDVKTVVENITAFGVKHAGSKQIYVPDSFRSRRPDKIQYSGLNPIPNLTDDFYKLDVI